MNILSRKIPLFLITDTGLAGMSHVGIVRSAIDAGVRMIQLREKHLPKKDIYSAALRIREMTRKSRVVFIVNDYVDIACAVDADGVHLGQEDMPAEEARKIMGKRKLIGVSTHTSVQAANARESGADYIGFGPMFHTATKVAGTPRGIAALREIRQFIDIPIVAIGGITWQNVNTVFNAGADVVAVASGVLTGDIKTNVKKFLRAIHP